MPATVMQIVVTGAGNAPTIIIMVACCVELVLAGTGVIEWGTLREKTAFGNRAGSQPASLTGNYEKILRCGIKGIQQLAGHEHLYMLHNYHNEYLLCSL